MHAIIFTAYIFSTINLVAYGFICDYDMEMCETTLVIQEAQELNVTDDGFHQQSFNNDVTHKLTLPPPIVNCSVLPLLLTVNGSIPGPPIVVYKDQRVKVHVINNMLSEATSIHWHGLHQRDSQYMDGVPFVTQCPILPGQIFTYDFVATQKGTHFYHSHIGRQQSRGLFGALIVKEKKEMENDIEDLILALQEWYEDGDQVMSEMIKGSGDNLYEFTNKEPFENMHPVSINGRGIYSKSINAVPLNFNPIETFVVKQNKQYRLRIIGSQGFFSFRVSVDQHPMLVIATDGEEITPVQVESLFINPGERYDVIVNTDNSIDNYWLRVVTDNFPAVHGEAIFRYEGANISDPTSHRETCSESCKCKVLNCPQKYFLSPKMIECIHLDQVESLYTDNFAPRANSEETLREYVLNFAYTDLATVNGIRHRNAEVASMVQPKQIGHKCNVSECIGKRMCSCFHSIDLKHNEVVQFVLTNKRDRIPRTHPVHVHGYVFDLLKIGFPNYNESTGQFMSENDDVVCDDVKMDTCNMPRWRKAEWNHGKAPGLRLNRAVRKDTLTIPLGGYLVIRFKANNPGVWSMHCHIEKHHQEGMFLVLNNSFELHPPPPRGFPTCNSYIPSTDFPIPTTDNVLDNTISKKTFVITLVSMATVLLLCFVYIVFLKYFRIPISKVNGYNHLESSPLKFYTK